MKIAVLDGFTLNPGDLSWLGLETLGETTIYDWTPVEEIFERAKGCEVALVNKTPLSGEMIRSLEKLQYIGVMATGYNVIDVQAASDRGIVVTNVPVYGTQTVAQATFALILELTNKVGHYSTFVREGGWEKSKFWSISDGTLQELSGKTIGIIGLGRIGTAVAHLAHAFGMKVLYTSPQHALSQDFPLHRVELTELLKESDIVSLHCPQTPMTTQLINESRLSLMKQSALLINTSRGGLIQEADLANALNSGKIGGAALDVLSSEPPSPENPLLRAKNCIITPHNAWTAKSARQRLLNTVVENLLAFMNGQPTNVVNPK